MDVREWINQIKKQTELIQYKKTAMLEMWSALLYPGISYDIKVQSSKNYNSHSDKIDKIIELEREIEAMEKQLQKQKDQVSKMADELEKQQREVIILRYLEFKCWDDIAEHLGCSRRWVMELNKRSLQKMSKMIEFTSI